MTVVVTRRQREVLAFVAEKIRSCGLPPTHREICRQLGFTSTNNAHELLLRLKIKGLLALNFVSPGSPAKNREFTISDAGWELLGFKRCEHCGSLVEPGKAA